MGLSEFLFREIIPMQADLKCLIFLPEDYETMDHWPCILFLHGAGERGNDLDLVKTHGPIKEAMAGKLKEFIIIAPQCPENTSWPVLFHQLIPLLDKLKTDFKITENQIYLTGISMGGYGTWHLATEYPTLFAAIAPICGGGDWIAGFPERVKTIKDLPIWAFHGEDDDLVSVKESEVLVEELESVDGDVMFTRYPNTGHDSWARTYANPALYEWFLSHRR